MLPTALDIALVIADQAAFKPDDKDLPDDVKLVKNDFTLLITPPMAEAAAEIAAFIAFQAADKSSLRLPSCLT